MFQNHLLQLMMITAMEAPVRDEAKFVRDEKVKVLQAIRHLAADDICHSTQRGQYDGYLQEPGVPQDSQTATFAALKLHIDNWRWKDVPFYLRSGKAMSCRTTQIVIQFREPPHFFCLLNNHSSRWMPTSWSFKFNSLKGFSCTSELRSLIPACVCAQPIWIFASPINSPKRLPRPINVCCWMRCSATPLHTYPIGMWGPQQCTQWMNGDGRQWFDVCPVL
jgi:glucose-6-phosphate 1-dehydrogenase